MLKMLVFDIDGVISDGKRYTDGKQLDLKTVHMRDMDAIVLLSKNGYKVGCISGEDNEFSRQFSKINEIDFVRLGCKDKESALHEIENMYHIDADEICYIGDGKYDIPALQLAGLAICPSDAIKEVKDISDIILKCRGGEGCLAECYSILKKSEKRSRDIIELTENSLEQFKTRVKEHQSLVEEVLEDKVYFPAVNQAIGMIVESYRKEGQIYLCGNGGSAADAQHLAAELVGRFYLERKAWGAEALTTNTSIITALANDYDYSLIFARQIEAKARRGDILIGITTSGTSENICNAFKKARDIGVKTILMTGEISEHLEILGYTDCLLSVPSKDTPQIQEIHIMTGHLICQFVEQQLVELEYKKWRSE